MPTGRRRRHRACGAAACHTEPMAFIVLLLVNAAAVWAAERLVTGIDFLAPSATHFALVLAVAGAIFAAVNTWVKPLAKSLSFPLYLLTLGLFGLVVNGLMFMLVGWISEQVGYGVIVHGFWSAFWGGVIVSLAVMIINIFLPRKYKVKKR